MPDHKASSAPFKFGQSTHGFSLCGLSKVKYGIGSLVIGHKPGAVCLKLKRGMRPCDRAQGPLC